MTQDPIYAQGQNLKASLTEDQMNSSDFKISSYKVLKMMLQTHYKQDTHTPTWHSQLAETGTKNGSTHILSLSN